MREEYVLILWPWIQELMEYSWFRSECYLLQGTDEQAHYDSSYFVPKARIEELEPEVVNRLF